MAFLQLFFYVWFLLRLIFENTSLEDIRKYEGSQIAITATNFTVTIFTKSETSLTFYKSHKLVYNYTVTRKNVDQYETHEIQSKKKNEIKILIENKPPISVEVNKFDKVIIDTNSRNTLWKITDPSKSNPQEKQEFRIECMPEVCKEMNIFYTKILSIVIVPSLLFMILFMILITKNRKIDQEIKAAINNDCVPLV